jgi:hypothetical protein
VRTRLAQALTQLIAVLSSFGWSGYRRFQPVIRLMPLSVGNIGVHSFYRCDVELRSGPMVSFVLEQLILHSNGRSFTSQRGQRGIRVYQD